MTDALTNTATYDYDAAGNRETATDRRGLTTSYVHNGFGEVIQQSSPDTGVTVFEYDSGGRRTKRTDARGVVTEWTYDDLGRKLTMTFPASPTENVAYTYDDPTAGYYGTGRLAGFTDESGITSYRYDARGNIVRVDTVIDGEAFTTEYTYDLADRVVRIDYPATTQFASYMRDANGRVTSLTTEKDGTVRTYADNIQYEPFGPVSSFNYNGNDLPHSRTYDLDGRLTTIQTVDDIGSGGVRQDLTYSYDLAGNITAIADAVDADRSQTFGYDELHRLVSATGVYGAYSYDYDAVGNRAERTRDPSDAYDYVETLSYDFASNRLEDVTVERYLTLFGNRSLESTNTHTYAYDSAGNVTNRNRSNGVDYEFEYSDRNRLKTTSNGSSWPIYGYRYNAIGQRALRKKLPDSFGGGDDAIFLYDLSGRLLVARARNGSWWRLYFWLDDMLVAVRANGTSYRVMTDHLGTPQKFMDYNGDWTAGIRLRPFGEVESASGQSIYLRFPGQYDDTDTEDLYYNYFRDYDPTAGRYIQSDPIGLGGGWNTYAYTGGNPVRRMDPKGLEFLDEFGEPILTPPSLRECAARVAAPWFKVRDENKVSDKYIHCMVGGLISQACGKSGGYFAGIGKEFQDWYNDTGVPDWGDAVATFDGENCALGIGGCKGYFQVKLAACCLRKGYKP